MSAECDMFVVYTNQTMHRLPGEEHPAPQEFVSIKRCTMGAVLGKLPDFDYHHVRAGRHRLHRHSCLLLLLLQV